VRRTLKTALGTAFSLVVTLGLLVIFTFDACPEGAQPADLNAEVCAVKDTATADSAAKADVRDAATNSEAP
jgi:hypothetical protein